MTQGSRRNHTQRKEYTCKARSGPQVGGGNGVVLFQHTRGGTIKPCYGYFVMRAG